MENTSDAADPSAPRPAQAGNRAAGWAGKLAVVVLAGAAAGSAWLPDVRSWTANMHARIPLHADLWFGRAAGAGVAFGIGIGAGWMVYSVQPLRRAAGLLLLTAVLAVTQSLVLAMHGIGWEPWSALFSMGAAAIAAGLSRDRARGAARFFAGRVSPSMLRQLDGAGPELYLVPAEREAAVLTCRLLNETKLREQMTSRDFLRLVEAAQECARRVLLAHDACLDSSEAAGARAFFGLPLPAADHADRAAKAAAALDEALTKFTIDHMHRSREDTQFGIGIASGTLTAGVTGAAWSVVGDAVEISRWLAAHNADYGSRILIDAATHSRAKALEDCPLEVLNPPEGAAVEVHRLLGMKGTLTTEALRRRDAFREGILLLRSGRAADAVLAFAKALRGAEDDAVAEHFASLAKLEASRDKPRAGTERPDRSSRKKANH